MAREKVAYFFGSLNRGGAETLVLDVLSRHSQLPYDALCIYRNEGTLSERYRNTGAQMIRLPRGKSWLGYIVRLSKVLRKEGVTVIHAQTSLNAILAVVCTWFTRVRAVTTFHGYGYINSPKLLRRLIFKGSDKVVFVSKELKDAYLKRGDFGCKEKCVIVYNGIDFDKFNILATGSNNKRLELCMVGSFGEGRNHLFVCKFLSRLLENGIDFHFTFIGAARDNEMKIYNDCVDYCKEHGLEGYVTFAGLRDDVPELLRGMDAFVYATRHDSFGIAVMEAVAAGLPTFVNDWCVMKELTREGELATLYETDNVDSLYDKFCDFVAHRDDYRTKAKENAILVRELYSIEQHIKTLIQVYAIRSNAD
ncbi:MAG: glycosyltransferase family 4 protein [Bacteroidales bacterium]|nr:glycosyltransferase family 4 protein [Bacteroidales bacterium]